MDSIEIMDYFKDFDSKNGYILIFINQFTKITSV
jgi:hypothetical protein